MPAETALTVRPAAGRGADIERRHRFVEPYAAAHQRLAYLVRRRRAERDALERSEVIGAHDVIEKLARRAEHEAELLLERTIEQQLARVSIDRCWRRFRQTLTQKRLMTMWVYNERTQTYGRPNDVENAVEIRWRHNKVHSFVVEPRCNQIVDRLWQRDDTNDGALASSIQLVCDRLAKTVNRLKRCRDHDKSSSANTIAFLHLRCVSQTSRSDSCST